MIATVQEVIPDVTLFDGLSKCGKADFIIWDAEAGNTLAAEILSYSDQQRLLVLVSKSQLGSVDPDVLGRACVLLKPVNAFMIRAFWDLAQKNWELTQRAGRADQLTCDREALLQYALAANLTLQEYDHQRTNFLARALHDLRSPLTALHGYCGLLADGHMGPLSSRQQELLARMQSSAQRLSRQTNGMFELSVLGRVRRTTALAQNDIEDAVDQAIHEVLPMAREKHITLASDIDEPESAFFFESEKVVQLLINILENCCRFTPAGGNITVRGYTHLMDGAVHYRVDVEDTGPGIRPDLLSSIFEQYTSYAGGQDRSGGGLGLAICKMIVTAHQGEIWASNSGNGAVFSFVLPLGSAPETYAESELEARLA